MVNFQIAIKLNYTPLPLLSSHSLTKEDIGKLISISQLSSLIDLYYQECLDVLQLQSLT